MRGRQVVFSDAAVQELLKQFVPAADEVNYLQRRKGPECELFQKIAEQGHYAGRVRPTGTRQGIYAATPNGTLLASINTVDPKRMAGMLEKALKRWKELSTEERTFKKLPDDKGRHRGERRYPKGGLVLKVHSRDLPRGGKGPPKDWRGKSWNQDFSWFKKEEARRFIPEKHETGAEVAVPKALIQRLVRLSLVDNVRGQTSPYRPEDVKRAELTSKVTRIDGDRVTIRLSGTTRAVARGTWAIAGFKDMRRPSKQERGFEATLLGRAVFDLKKERFTQFDLLAVGTRWGATQYNGRADDLEPAPIGVSFELAGDTPADKVAPAFWWKYSE